MSDNIIRGKGWGYFVVRDRVTELYQAGLLDMLRKKEPLTAVLAAAGETELALAYASGLLVGSQLLLDDAT